MEINTILLLPSLVSFAYIEGTLLINHQTQLTHASTRENQRTFSRVASFTGKTTALFDSKLSEAFFLSIADTELKPDALAE